MKKKECGICGKPFIIKAPAQKYCSKECKAIPIKKSRWKDHVRDMKKKGRAKYIGVGSGGTVGKGEKSIKYKNGTGLYTRYRDELYKISPFCTECGKCLIDLPPHSWCGHHVDKDRCNNNKDNIRIVCKSCHQIIHKVYKNFEGSTTIPKGSTPKQVEAVSNLI